MTETSPVHEELPKRLLVLGGEGMLGSDFVEAARRSGLEVVAPSQAELDILSMPDLERLSKHGFGELDWIVNCAAYTAVDQAETDEMAALKVNGVAPGSVAAICQANGWKLLHMSTDFVFDGEGVEPYSEDAMTSPIGAYGRSKLLGEQNVSRECGQSVIVRTSWLFGPRGKSFPRTIITAARSGKPLSVVNDQTGTPTYTGYLAQNLVDIVLRDVPAGIYHAAGPDVMTWFELAGLALESYRAVTGEALDVPLTAVDSSAWPTAAKRPRYSALNSSKLARLGIGPMEGTKKALTEFCQRLAFDANV